MVERETNPPRHKLKFWHIALVILGLLLVLFGVYRIALRAKLQGKLAAVRAAGYPITLAELDDWYTIPQYADNAADYITGAFGYLHMPEKEVAKPLPVLGNASLTPRTEPVDEQTLATMAQVVQDNQAAFELLEKAATMEACRFPADFKQGQALLVSHIGSLRDAVQLLSIRALLQAEQGEPEAAVNTLLVTFRTADSLAQEPLLISQLVRRACQVRALTILERVMVRVNLDDRQLARVAEMLDVAYDPNSIARAFAGERCMIVAGLLDIRSAGDGVAAPGVPGVVVVGGARALGRVDSALIGYIDLMAGHIDAMRLPPTERVAACVDLERQGEELRRRHRILGQFLPSFHRFIVDDLAHMMQIETARTAVAVQRYRLANGRWPEDLAELTPTFLAEVPQDAFSGRSLRYLRLDPGFVVYSVGKDRTDDSGQERQRRRSGQTEPLYDITFTVER